jgi:formylglycine-generating enzyme
MTCSFDYVSSQLTEIEMTMTTRMTLPEIESGICDLTADFLRMPRSDVVPSSRLIEDLHCDSLDLIELIIGIEDRFSVTIPNGDPTHFAVKSVFTRSPFRLRDFAEIVHLQWGTGTPEQRHRRVQRPSTEPTTIQVPFTQLSGRFEWEGQAVDALFELLPTETVPQYRCRSDGMRCLLIPAAEVTIGNTESDSFADEKPIHSVHLDSFLIDAEPVSTTAYCRFLNSIAASDSDIGRWILTDATDDRIDHMLIERSHQEWTPVAGCDELPMILVSWYGANAYALWANGRDWNEFRTNADFLPSECQWEYAARGTRPRRFPWGDRLEPDKSQLVSAQHYPGKEYQPQSLPMKPVHFPLGVSPFGLFHMAGNVWQWCRDWYASDFYQMPQASEPNPVNVLPTDVRSERGGSWVGPTELCRSSYRRGRAPHAMGRCLGFRCLRDPVAATH